MDLTAWRGAVRVLEEVLFPGRCLLCGGWLLGSVSDRAPVCNNCRGSLEQIQGTRCARCGIGLVSETGTCTRCRNVRFSFSSNRSLFAYTGSARRLLSCLKFQRRNRLAPFYAARVAEETRAQNWGTVIVPVPPRPGRSEPDAVELVARCLARRHGIDVRRLLCRAPGVQQKTLDYEQRRANLQGRIRLRRGRAGRRAANLAAPQAGSQPSAVPPRAILLDDVFTTGATLDACARVLRDAGCGEVYAITLVMEE